MKTFETEKNNIPEGATHYRDQDKHYSFAWVKVSNEVFAWNKSLGWWEFAGQVGELNEAVKPIPKPEAAEWNGGDKCLYMGGNFVFIGMLCVPTLNGTADCMIQHEDGAPIMANVSELSKPESQEEKDKREAVQKAMDFLAEDDHGGEAYYYKGWFEALYDEGMLTNYRKGE